MKAHIIAIYTDNLEIELITIEIRHILFGLTLFLALSCNNDGTQSDHSIKFTPSIASKQFGAILPHDYKVD